MKRTSGLDLQGTGASKANIRASMVVASWLHLRFNIPGISLRVLAFSSGSSRFWCLGQCYQKVCPPMFYARDGNGIACLWLCLSELRQLPYFRHVQTPSHWRNPLTTFVSLWPRLVVPSILYCCFNVLFFKYFLHTFRLVWLFDNPSLLFVWEEAKIWTQSTPHALISHFCSITCMPYGHWSDLVVWSPLLRACLVL